MNGAEKAFEKTTNLILGRTLKRLERYGDWLCSDIPKFKMFETREGKVPMPNISIYKHIPADRMAGLDYAEENSKKKLGIVNPSFPDLANEFKKIGRAVCEVREGTNTDIEESNFYLNVQSSYKIAFCFYSKFCAYNIWSSFNDYTFGCYRNMNGNFSINCYFSTELLRCLEMDACKKCSDSMFCHNCENVHDSLFCFNVKNMRNAIGNTVVGREKYLEIRGMFVGEILKELEATGKLGLGIYNI
ncbi:MAG: hypothetical protein ABIG39_05745 [Candidatus Micrarchaeota archaeon]